MRMFTAPLSKELSWLLPFGLVSILFLAFRSRLRWPIAPRHQALILWGGWLVIGVIFFSVAGFFHSYYLSILGAPLAALVGIGVVELWRWRSDRPWLAAALLFVAAVWTLWLQYTTASAYVTGVWWFPLLIGLFLIGVTLLLGSAPTQLHDAAIVGFACIVAALLITPAIWSGLTAVNSSGNQSLPAAYDGQSGGPQNRGGVQVDQALLNFLEANTQNVKYLMAVPGSMQGADYVLATGRPVLYLGGFNGMDQVETRDSLAKLVADGELRYIYLGGGGGPGGGPGGGQSDISSWVTSTCKAVQGYDTTTQNVGAPDGTSSGSQRAGGSMQIALYDCQG